LALDLLAALSAAHERGIVHRDVKPANVFFDLAGNAKLGDFGGAHLVDFGQTQTGGFLGTLAYMSPEQITGAPIGFAADLYALGATLFQALTGRPPFLGPDLVGQHLAERPPAPTSLRGTLWPAHDLVLLRALAKSPNDRFSSAVDMAEAIAAWPVETAPLGPDEPDGVVAAPASPELSRPESGAVFEDRELWHGPEARLVRRRDLRTARDVVVQERLQPLDDTALGELRRLAGAGGPHVQRVLRVSDDRRAIWYEAIDGEVQPLDELTATERARIGDVLANLPAGLADGFVRTPGGPVLLVMPRAPS
jgi:serine/threonine-protein kinase